MKCILFIYSPALVEHKRASLEAIRHTLNEQGYTPIVAEDMPSAADILMANPRVCAVVLDWSHYDLHALTRIAAYNPDLPVFAFGDTHQDIELNLHDFDLNIDFMQYDAIVASENASRIMKAIQAYFEQVIPPFTRELMHYEQKQNYSFCTPGHQQGEGFQKSPAGTAFYDFFGPNIFKTDISISMGELGSLLDHSGVHKKAEDFIARVFGSDRSLIVTNGTSTSNKIVGMYAAGEGDTVLVDRNCHKSIAHFMMMVNVNPVYLKPTRNAHGIIGGIPKEQFSDASIQAQLDAHPVANSWPRYAVVTNSTYDGIFYNVEQIHQQLNVPYLHFDSAWVPYTHFHPLYKGKYGMGITPKEGHTIFETQSTHKLLAAFSQASMVHLKGEHDEEKLNETFMMHTSTSPFYPLVASCEVSAAMMKGKVGESLINDCIQQAMDFRREVVKLRDQSDSWYYDIWQPADIRTTRAWPVDSNSDWHGFTHSDDNFLYLDPVKVTVLLPGIEGGKPADWGIPASIVAAFLEDHGIIVEKTGPYCMLFLFSIGITRAKSMRLLAILNKFKQMYDQDLPVAEVLPSVYQAHPDFYADKSIQAVTRLQHRLIMHHNLPAVLHHAFDVLPEFVINPYGAYQRLLKGKTRKIALDDLCGEISAVMVLPYPPGIPLIMPGERITEQSRVILEFLQILEEIGSHLPGFESDIHGLEKGPDGQLYIKVVDDSFSE